MKGSSGIF